MRIGGIVPFGIHPLEDARHILCGEHIMERYLVKYHGDALFDLRLVLSVVKAEQADLAGVDLRDMQQAADRRRFSRAVLSDEAHDAALRQVKADRVQHEAVIALGHAPDLDRVFVVVHVILLR